MLKETYKRAEYLYQDKASVIVHQDGIDNKAVETHIETAVGEQQNNILTNQINKWAELLDTVRYANEVEDNIQK